MKPETTNNTDLTQSFVNFRTMHRWRGQSSRVANNALSIACFLAIAMHARAGINDGLLARFPFDGGANDVSGNGRSTTNVGCTLVADRFGCPDKAFAFGTGKSVAVADPGRALNFDARSNNYTVTLWVKLDSNTLNQYQTLVIDRGTMNNGHSSYFLSYMGTPRRFEAGVWDGLNGVTVTNATALVADQWYHVAMVVSNRTLRLYVNGLDETVPALNGGVLPQGFGSTLNSEGIRNIGRFAGQVFANYLNGALDDVRIYNRDLSPSELEELYVQTTLDPTPEIYFGINIRDGVPGQVYTVQTTTNLTPPVSWATSTTFTQSCAGFLWVDTSSPANAPKKFYRVIP